MTGNKTLPILETKEQATYNYEVYFGNEVLKNAGELLEGFERPLLSRNDTQITHRVLNWWVKEKVISDNVLETKKFTFVEFVWIKIVEQLRNLSIGLNVTKSFKDQFLKSIKVKGIITKEKKVESFLKTVKLNKEQKKQLLALLNSNIEKEHTLTILHLLITDYFIKRRSISLGIFSDGSFIIIDKNKEGLANAENNKQLHFSTYITVSLSEILKEFLLSPIAGNILKHILLPFVAENKAIETINSGNYKNITLYFKNKKNSPIQIKAGDEAKEKLMERLFYNDQNEISEIEVIDKKGNTIKYNSTPTLIL